MAAVSRSPRYYTTLDDSMSSDDYAGALAFGILSNRCGRLECVELQLDVVRIPKSHHHACRVVEVLNLGVRDPQFGEACGSLM